MSKKTVRVLVLGLALCVFSLVPAVGFAQEGAEEEATIISAEEPKSTRGEQLKARIAELKEKRQEQKEKRLEANKLRVCEQRKTKITAILNRSVTRGERQLELFTTIANRVKAFYINKNLSLANYEELVAAVDTAKTDAQATLETLKGLTAFDCNAEDPKGDAEAFKLAQKALNEDLKSYRTAVKDLIVGVKSSKNNGTNSEGSEQ
jgi:hypothetical protein